MKFAMLVLAFLVADRFSGGEIRTATWRMAQQKAWSTNARLDGWLSVMQPRSNSVTAMRR
jgi:hypothetical protein